MSFTDVQFDRAFAEFQEFGPRRTLRVEDRWRKVLFDVFPDDYPALRARCEEIAAFAVTLAERVRDHEMTAEVANKSISDKYPFLTRERLIIAWNRAMYSAIK